MNSFMKSAFALMLSMFILGGCSATTSDQAISRSEPDSTLRTADGKPVNVLWLYGEDISPWMPAFGDDTVATPNIDFLVDNGVVFTNTYSISPVCSPTRSGLVLGVMPTTAGVHNHRSGRSDDLIVELPDHMQVLPVMFKEAGFHTFNEGKDDFNWQYDWDDYWTGPHEEPNFYGKAGHGSWNDAGEDQPFFGVIELFGGKSRIKTDTPVSLDRINVPPYYPDTPQMRRDIATHYNQIQVTDVEVGEIIEQLKADDLYDSTIIIFMSDNGYRTLRDKQFLYDGGIHMPLVIAAPGNPALLGHTGVRDDVVSLLDVTATTLGLMNMDIPEYYESKDLFADDFHRDYVVSVRDRADYTIDRIRSVRTRDFKYIRNFMTDRPLMQPQYRDGKRPTEALLKAYRDGVPFYSKWLEDYRPAEELYDHRTDPHEINNLAEDPRYEAQLELMRGYLAEWIAETGDLGQYPESKESLRLVLERWPGVAVNPEFQGIE